ncbi:hypothetical protein [Clostridium estertheticum]|uniref:hypothetical protein n=1 Tax=Clostridium estertheticum TaxID=238834 RepID=UPI001CF1D281|nr:hypothetical protein [Clostridium estertheticum]MCB2361603.1 hypothetical protein [Clostridium estertheticum]
MNDDKSKKCKKKECNNPVLDGKYCRSCKQIRKEKRDNFMKVVVGTAVGVCSIALEVIHKKKPK